MCLAGELMSKCIVILLLHQLYGIVGKVDIIDFLNFIQP